MSIVSSLFGPTFQEIPTVYEPRFDTLNEAVTNAKEQQEYLQSEISVEDFDNADCESRFGCDELPYVLVEGSWDDDGLRGVGRSGYVPSCLSLRSVTKPDTQTKRGIK